MEFANGFSTFMDTEKESRLWHKGIYKGLKKGFKVHNPAKVYQAMKLSETGYKEWYADDGHYFDVPFIFMYVVSSAVELGVLALLGSYLGV